MSEMIDVLQATNCNTIVQSLIYSIELNRHGGPLGITIASSGEVNEPVTVSQLASGGLAQRTGALQVGDQILAVNGKSVSGMRVAEVMQLLQQSADLVSIKLLRNLDPESLPMFWQSNQHRLRMQHPVSAMTDSYSETSEKIGTPVQSIDSALESLDDSLNGASKYQSGGTGGSDLQHQLFAVDDQMPNTSNLRNAVFDQMAWDSRPSSAGNNAALEQCCSCHTNVASLNSDNWMKVLEALETVGEAEMLRRLDECTRDNGAAGNYTDSSLILQCHESAIAQRGDLRLQCQSPLVARPQYPLSNIKVISMRQSSSPSTMQNKISPYCSQFSSTEQIDSLSISNDTQASTSLCDIPNYRGPPKPPRFEHANEMLSTSASLMQHELVQIKTMPSNMSKESTPPPKSLMLHELSNKTFALKAAGTTHRVRLRRNLRTSSFGFSVSDGVGDNPGVFINAILPSGPADLCGQIMPFDKILQVNDTSLQYLDCDLALPLLNVDEIELVLYREQANANKRSHVDESCRNSLSLSLRDSAV